MNTAEFKAGQKWRVVDAYGFNNGMPTKYAQVRNGDLLIVSEVGYNNHVATIAQTGEDTLICTIDALINKSIVLSEDTQEYDIQVYEDGSWGPSTRVSISEDGLVTSPENILGACVAPLELSKDDSPAWASSVPEGVETHAQESTDSSKNILWHIISRTERYNGHSRLTISEMDLSTLITLTRMLDDYVEEFCELRLSWAGDHMGYYTADIYEHVGSPAEDDRILMQVEKVTGI